MSQGTLLTENAPLMTTGQFSRRLGLHRYQVVHLIETGQIPDAGLRVGGRRLFSEAELLAAAEYLKQRKQAAADRKGVQGNQ